MEVIASNDAYVKYMNSLAALDKYVFDTKNEFFQGIYRDTILELHDRGFLFADDPEFINLQHAMKLAPTLSTSSSIQSVQISTTSILPNDQPPVFQDEEVLKNTITDSQAQAQTHTQSQSDIPTPLPIQPRPAEEELGVSSAVDMIMFDDEKEK